PLASSAAARSASRSPIARSTCRSAARRSRARCGGWPSTPDDRGAAELADDIDVAADVARKGVEVVGDGVGETAGQKPADERLLRLERFVVHRAAGRTRLVEHRAVPPVRRVTIASEVLDA